MRIGTQRGPCRGASGLYPQADGQHGLAGGAGNGGPAGTGRRLPEVCWSPPETVIECMTECANRSGAGEIVVKCLEQPYRRDFPEADIKQIISGYQSGKSTIVLAEEFNCSKNAINKLLREHGMSVTRAKAQMKLDAKVVIAMYEEQHTIEKSRSVSA